jgi:hypothetical protein
VAGVCSSKMGRMSRFKTRETIRMESTFYVDVEGECDICTFLCGL